MYFQKKILIFSMEAGEYVPIKSIEIDYWDRGLQNSKLEIRNFQLNFLRRRTCLSACESQPLFAWCLKSEGSRVRFFDPVLEIEYSYQVKKEHQGSNTEIDLFQISGDNQLLILSYDKSQKL